MTKVADLLETANTCSFREIAKMLHEELTSNSPRRTAIDGLVAARLDRHAEGWHYPDMRDGKQSKGKARCRFPKQEINLLTSLNPDAATVFDRGKTSKSGKWVGDSNDDEFLAALEQSFVTAAINGAKTEAELAWKMLGCASMVRTVRQTAAAIHEAREAKRRERIKTDPRALAEDLARELSA